MSNYSEDKNPYEKCDQCSCNGGDECLSPLDCPHDAYENGFLDGEASAMDRMFTEEEKTVYKDMVVDHDPDLEKWPSDLINALESLKTKILGK